MCTTHNLLTPNSSASTEAAGDAAVEATMQRLFATANEASAAFMISIGHRTGLFDAMAPGDSLTSQGWAERGELDERYVREWLAAMVMAGIVELAQDGVRYRLPADRAALLGRAAPLGNMAAMFQFFAVLGGVESRIVECFRTGGGVPYAAFDRFHEVMAEESGQTVLPYLLSDILPLAPGVLDRLRDGISVVDVGCGIGRALQILAREFPQSRFFGYDLCQEAVEQARAEAMAAGLSNLTFEIVDATTMRDEQRFDLALTFDAVHDQAQPGIVLANIRRALAPGGVYLMQDIYASSVVADNLDHPLGAFLYTISCMHCMTVSLAQGGIGLGAAWGEQVARRLLGEAGFTDVDMHRLPHDVNNAYYVCSA